MKTAYDAQELVTVLARLVDTIEPAQAEQLAALLRPRDEAVFRRQGQYWTLEYAGRLTLLRDARGLQHLARLLAQPGTPLHVLSLVGHPAGSAPRRAPDPTLKVSADDGEPAIDAQACRSYRRRLRELDEELRQAGDDGDEGRRWRLSEERDCLLGELRRALGLGGRARRTASPTERARVAVRKAIRSSVEAVAANHPELGEHLRTTVRTGTFCCYSAVGLPTWRC